MFLYGLKSTRPDIKMCNKVFKMSAKTSARTSGATSVGYKYIAQDCCRGLCRGPKIIPNKQLYESYRLPYNRMPYQIPGLCPGIIKGKRSWPKATDALFVSRALARETRTVGSPTKFRRNRFLRQANHPIRLATKE